MKLFTNLKKILFEDDDEEEEVNEMPTYTKEDVVESPKRVDAKVESTPVVEEPIKTSDNSHFSNVKRDIDLNYDEKEVLGEIPGAKEAIPDRKVEENSGQQPPKKEEKKSVFLSFDEEEFERLNSRITKNENKARKEVQQPQNTNLTNEARRANNNFSATSTSRDTRIENVDRYKNNSSNNGRKTFTPSPIISPVYGILDKNYTKEDIVDKKGGMKREKVIKPIVRHEPDVTIEQAETTIEVDIDSVRKKAYGSLSELEKNLTKSHEQLNKKIEKEEEKIEVPELKKEEKTIKETSLVEKKEPIAVVEEEKVEKDVPSIEDQLDEKFTVDDIPLEQENVELDKVVEEVIEKNNDSKKQVSTKSNPKMLDDLEKTSTLQILDDIEKELNSIKPISKDVNVIEEDEEEITNNSDTLEKDLFNLIDSMYLEGEEEEDD